MSRGTNATLGAAYGMYSGEPTHINHYRQRTDKHIPFNWKSRVCPCCKRSRSSSQFKEGHTVCRRCPEPVEENNASI